MFARKPHSNWQKLWCESSLDLLILWSPPQILLNLSSHLLTGVLPTEFLAVTTFIHFNHSRWQAVTDAEPAGLKLLLPENDYSHFDFKKPVQRHCIPLWLNHKWQTDLALAEPNVLPLKWLNCDFIQEPSSLPLPPKTSQQLFEDLCDSSEKPDAEDRAAQAVGSYFYRENNKMQIMTDMACDTDGPGLF